MVILIYDDWYDKYGAEALEEYLIELDQEDSEYDCPPDEQDEWLTDEYEAYTSDYADYAYEQYKDNKLFNED